MQQHLDILVFGAHPDDIEICAGGFILAMVAQGKKVGVIEITQGEMGTRGTKEIRLQEAQSAAKILGLSIRENLHIPDAWITNSQENKLKVIEKIRTYTPDIVICNPYPSRHPDHGNTHILVKEAFFLSGLMKIETIVQGNKQVAHRPSFLFSFMQDKYCREPSFIFDISPYFEKKVEAILAHQSQFFRENATEPETILSKQKFRPIVEAMNTFYGRMIGVQYGEGFISEKIIGLKSLDSLVKSVY